ncbi:MAG: hypothetical protein J2P57_01875 [Acidimicrobiaceae bacterium]|nr:hypothetical protein [Acidimicrobiaceae bacterium]
MLKRIRFATRRSDLAGDGFANAWREAARVATDAPPEVRPTRVTVSVALPAITPDPKHDGIGLEWFLDADHLARYEAWAEGPGAPAVDDALGRALDVAASPVLVADEVVMRGGTWLEQRWQQGGDKLKHMAIAHRAHGLTPAQFSERWKSRAGVVQVPGQANAVTIPDRARGLAYVQNHQQIRPDHEWAYDAFNEVYFDDEDSLRQRVDWFKETVGGLTEQDLVSEGWFVAAREEVL